MVEGPPRFGRGDPTRGGKAGGPVLSPSPSPGGTPEVGHAAELRQYRAPFAGRPGRGLGRLAGDLPDRRTDQPVGGVPGWFPRLERLDAGGAGGAGMGGRPPPVVGAAPF